MVEQWVVVPLMPVQLRSVTPSKAKRRFLAFGTLDVKT